MQNKLPFLFAALALSATAAKANTIGLYDDSFSIFSGTIKIETGIYETKWGTYSDSFTPLLGTSADQANAGYIDVETPEFVANLSQTNNANIAAGSQLALVVTLLADDSELVASPLQLVLTDPSWVAPTFVFLETPFVSVEFTQNTTVLAGGTFNYNGGNEILTIGVVPEPSSFAAFAGLAVLGAVATRRRRSA